MRLLIAARLMWSIALLSTAGRPSRVCTSPLVGWGARALALRHLIEAGVLVRGKHSEPPRWTVTIDGLHAASMVPVAAVSRGLRRDALVSAAAAGALSGLSGVLRRRW